MLKYLAPNSRSNGGYSVAIIKGNAHLVKAGRGNERS